jgi:hypothetical protein
MPPGENAPSRRVRTKAVAISAAASAGALLAYIVYRLDGGTFCVCFGFN